MSESNSRESSRCRRCGHELGSGALAGVCPKCLALDGLADSDSRTSGEVSLEGDFAQPRVMGDYELLEEIARGGMGVVFKARQKSLNRIVAVKVIRSGWLAHAAEMARFRAEARAVAGLQHPNIVAVHEVGEHDGQPFFSMEFVAGRNLDELVREHPLPPIRAARYVKSIAEAIEHAHQRGVLHRDLKPSNVLIDQNDQPRVTDFGLAKRLTDSQLSTAGPQLTLTGQLLGSPNFMPPEQAAAGQGSVGPASDVYSIGAILYHLLAGRPPFMAETMTATLRMVAENEPASPRVLVPTVPQDLETICLKCLQKEPAQRYTTAQELADELGRFLRDEPIHARPAGGIEKAWRWCRRKPALASSIALVLLLALVVGIGSPIALVRINRERLRAEKLAVSETQHRRHAENLSDVNHQRLYATRVNLAQQVYEAGDVARALELLNSVVPRPGEEDLRGFEWAYLWKLCHNESVVFTGHTGSVFTVAFSPDGNTVASGGDDTVIRLWEPLTGKSIRELRGHSNAVSGVAFLPDSKSLISVSADSTARLWDLDASGQSRVLFSAEGIEFKRMALSRDGELLAVGTGQVVKGANSFGGFLAPRVGGREEHVTIWSLREKKEVTRLHGHPNGVSALAFSSDGTRLVTGGRDGVIRLWNSLTWQQSFATTNAPVWDVSFSPDGQRFAVGEWVSSFANGNVKIRRADTGAELPFFIDQPGSLACLAWSPTGKRIVTAGPDQIVRAWTVETGRLYNRRVGHTNVVWSLAYSPTGSKLASAGGDGTVRVWEAISRTGERDISSAANFSLAFSPDGKWLVSGGHSAKVWDAQTRATVATLPQLNNQDINVAFSPAGQVLATCGADAIIHLYETKDWTQLGVLAALSNRVPALAFSPDGETLAAAVRDKTVRLFDMRSRRERLVIGNNPEYVQTVAWTPDGKTIISGGNPVRLTDAQTGRERARIPVWAIRVAVSPDGRKLAMAVRNYSIGIFDLTTLKEEYRLKGHRNEIFAITFSPDSKTLATASWDSSVRLWHVTSGEPLLTFNSSWMHTWSVAFAPDNRTFAFSAGSQIGGGAISLLHTAAATP